jgi:hypothetical protein
MGRWTRIIIECAEERTGQFTQHGLLQSRCSGLAAILSQKQKDVSHRPVYYACRALRCSVTLFSDWTRGSRHSLGMREVSYFSPRQRLCNGNRPQALRVFILQNPNHQWGSTNGHLECSLTDSRLHKRLGLRMQPTHRHGWLWTLQHFCTPGMTTSTT